jgi:hypothetical protein
MSDLDDFLTSSADEVDSIFGTSVMVCSGQTFNVVVNEIRESKEGALGGLETDVQAVVTAQAADVANAKSLHQKRCTLDGDAYRIAEVVVGPIAVHFSLENVDNSK